MPRSPRVIAVYSTDEGYLTADQSLYDGDDIFYVCARSVGHAAHLVREDTRVTRAADGWLTLGVLAASFDAGETWVLNPCGCILHNLESFLIGDSMPEVAEAMNHHIHHHCDALLRSDEEADDVRNL